MFLIYVMGFDDVYYENNIPPAMCRLLEAHVSDFWRVEALVHTRFCAMGPDCRHVRDFRDRGSSFVKGKRHG